MQISSEILQYLEVARTRLNIEDEIRAICEATKMTLANNQKVFFAGNGGSAADAQHLSVELTGRFRTERKSLPGIALTTNTSELTAIANDYGYEKIFLRQLEGLSSLGDLL